MGLKNIPSKYINSINLWSSMSFCISKVNNLKIGYIFKNILAVVGNMV